MKPHERDAVISFAESRQLLGELFAYTVDEGANSAEFLVPLDVSPERFPTAIGTVRIVLVWLPRPEELCA